MEAAESIGVESAEWALAHEALSKLRLKRAGLDAEEGKWLLRASRAATHLYFGHASFGEYIERLFGLNRRATEEKLRVAEALEKLPELEHALRSGQLNWSVARELTRVAAPDTESEWIAAARRKTVRQVERMVSGLARGDRPTDRRRPELVRHVLRLEVAAETLATFREATRLLRKRSDHRLDDDAVLLSMAREVLNGPSDPGRASYQIVVTRCEDCDRGFQHANGESIPLDPAILEMCHCDAQNIPIAPPHPVVPSSPNPDIHNRGKLPQSDARTAKAGAPARSHLAEADAPAQSDARARSHVGERDEPTQSDAPAQSDARARSHVGERDEPTQSDARAHDGSEPARPHVLEARSHVGERDEPTQSDARAQSDSCAWSHVGERDEPTRSDARARSHVGERDEPTRSDAPAPSDTRARSHVGEADAPAPDNAQLRRPGVTLFRPKRQRATQDTPPAIRRQVFWRDRGRCVVPGCRNATYLDLHHLDLRSDGGDHDPDNLVVLCGAHHRAAHRGHFCIDGKVSTGIRVRHADGTAYGFMPSPTLADASAKTFAALTNLGYSEKTARAALERALAETHASTAKETLLRSALAHASRS